MCFKIIGRGKCMEDKRKRAFAEVYDIIQHSEKGIKEKISPKFINILENNMDRSQTVNIDYNKELREPNILHETKIILGIIYRDYLCSPEEKQQLIKNENELYEKIEKAKQEKYSVDNLFKNVKCSVEKTNEPTEIVVIKELKWYEKLFNKIKGIFKR